MDFKQKNILKKICEQNNIEPENMTFKQFRNLKEFRYFEIERINPNHFIKLKGKLKKKHIHDNQKNRIINVGEIIIYGSIVFLIDQKVFYYCFASFVLSLFSLQLCFFDNPFEIFKIYVNWYRRRFRFRKNTLCN